MPLDKKKCIVGLLTYNNGPNLEKTLLKFEKDFPFEVVVHVDGSNDGSDECLKNFPFHVLRSTTNSGVGRSAKNVIEYARKKGFEAVAIIPGNNKNDPREISRLMEPILTGEADYVQGSRYLPGSNRDNTPLFRLVMVKVHALLFSILTGKKCSDALEGFRAYKFSILDNPEIDIWQDWLDTYEYETYLHYKVLKLGYNYAEVPVSKVYPTNKKNILNRSGEHISHIRPIWDWWKILRPLIFLILRIKK